jgi:NAD+ kinase
VNYKKKDALKFANTLIESLKKNKCEVYFRKKIANCLDHNSVILKKNMIEFIDFILVLGGDGTLLSVVRTYAKFNKPVFGINLGHTGYLTGIEKNNFSDVINLLINKKYIIEKRSMLEIKNNNTTALNDICIAKSSLSRMLCFDLFINNNFIETYKSDGIIVSTPTGSTAYNLSAGGPIIEPTLHVIILTPICAHTLYSRPIVISDNDEIKIKIKSELKHAKIIFDGQKVFCAEKNILIKKSNLNALIIKLHKAKKNNLYDFYDIMRKKLIK